MKSRISFGLSALVLIFLLAQTGQAWPSLNSSSDTLSNESVAAILQKQFGDHVRFHEKAPSILKGDFNGDGHPDIAVVVRVEEAKSELKDHQVILVDSDPFSATNGSRLNIEKFEPHNCLGIVFIHGSGSGWDNPVARFLDYDCFSSAKLFEASLKVSRRISKKRGPRLVGDAVILEMEDGSSRLLYWTGKNYKGFSLRNGD